MKIKVDLTREKFDDINGVDFYDGKTLFFDIPTTLPKNLEIEVWGASLMPEFDWTTYVNLEEDTRLREIIDRSKSIAIQIQGFGKLRLEGLVGGNIEVSPLDITVKEDYTYFRDRQGQILSFRREWSMESVDSTCYEYGFDSKVAFPFGHCDLNLYAKGNVVFEFDTDDCVHYHDYVLNPNRDETYFGFVKCQELASNTFKDFKI
ncbi:hypothetical protein [Paenibacillus tundrae]|uniref:Uncharacterized protein n=1 Tax=Paenibacillus tundrae TaxID=528187 RepID=A0ABT9WHR4_9BACL|nr:hypothetical protein [Paenibacillus tundrae]MDQ0172825.1 hypothetical protein [Paenibacillus tundrae]